MNAAFGCSGPLASRMLHSSLGPKLTFTILTNVCDEELNRTHVSSGGILCLALVVRWQAERCIPPMDLKLDFAVSLLWWGTETNRTNVPLGRMLRSAWQLAGCLSLLSVLNSPSHPSVQPQLLGYFVSLGWAGGSCGTNPFTTSDLWSAPLFLYPSGIHLHSLLFLSWNWKPTFSLLHTDLLFSFFSFYQPVISNVCVSVCVCVVSVSLCLCKCSGLFWDGAL